jgi:Histidine kinase
VRLPAPLHDIVAHSLGVLVFQADVGEQLIDRDPGQAREAFRAIRAAGLEAVGEMGTILGLIRGDGVTGGNPSPGRRHRDAGARTCSMRAHRAAA